MPHYGKIFRPFLCLRGLFACKWVCPLIIAKKSESHFPVLVLSKVSYPRPTPAFIWVRAKPGTVSCGTVKECVISVDNHSFPISHFGLQRDGWVWLILSAPRWMNFPKPFPNAAFCICSDALAESQNTWCRRAVCCAERVKTAKVTQATMWCCACLVCYFDYLRIYYYYYKMVNTVHYSLHFDFLGDLGGVYMIHLLFENTGSFMMHSWRSNVQNERDKSVQMVQAVLLPPEIIITCLWASLYGPLLTVRTSDKSLCTFLMLKLQPDIRD